MVPAVFPKGMAVGQAKIVSWGVESWISRRQPRSSEVEVSHDARCTDNRRSDQGHALDCTAGGTARRRPLCYVLFAIGVLLSAYVLLGRDLLLIGL